MMRLAVDPIDHSKFALYDRPGYNPKIVMMVGGRFSRRVPRELVTANGLIIKALNKTCNRVNHNHKMIYINEIDLCPVSAMLFLAAAKSYHWSDGLEAAINKILEVSKGEG